MEGGKAVQYFIMLLILCMHCWGIFFCNVLFLQVNFFYKSIIYANFNCILLRNATVLLSSKLPVAKYLTAYVLLKQHGHLK